METVSGFLAKTMGTDYGLHNLIDERTLTVLPSRPFYKVG